MSALVEWLSARLGEDQAAAEACVAAVGAHREGELYDDGSGIADRDAFPSYPWGSEGDELAFMAGPGHPARVLAEVAAKRRIIAEHPTLTIFYPDSVAGMRIETPEWFCKRCRDDDDGPVEEPCQTLRLLALPYAGRDGYQDSWRPE